MGANTDFRAVWESVAENDRTHDDPHAIMRQHGRLRLRMRLHMPTPWTGLRLMISGFRDYRV